MAGLGCLAGLGLDARTFAAVPGAAAAAAATFLGTGDATTAGTGAPAVADAGAAAALWASSTLTMRRAAVSIWMTETACLNTKNQKVMYDSSCDSRTSLLN